MSERSAPPLVSEDMDLFTLMLRLKVRLEEDDPANLAWVLPEVLVRCQSGVHEPGEVFDAIARLARSAPESGKPALLEALERGVDVAILEGLVGLLAELGCDVAEREADALRRLSASRAGERVHAMYLLCALGPTTVEGCRAVLEADLVRLWRLEQVRVEALVRQRKAALPACIDALAHDAEAVRARAEAALVAMGPDAAPAVPALLSLPAWGVGDDRPSPALYAFGEAAVPLLAEGLSHPSALVSSRAKRVLEAMGALPEG
jgi:hypothetical protein